MWRSTILATLALSTVTTAASSAHDGSDSARFERQLSELTAQIRTKGDTSIGHPLASGPALSTHPWGGAVWLDDGFVTIDKAELGPVNARRPSFTLGFQRLPRSECERLLSVQDGENVAGDGVLQVSARNIETGRFVSFKGAGLDTTEHQVGVACDGSLFTVTVSFDFRG